MNPATFEERQEARTRADRRRKGFALRPVRHTLDGTDYDIHADGKVYVAAKSGHRRVHHLATIARVIEGARRTQANDKDTR